MATLRTHDHLYASQDDSTRLPEGFKRISYDADSQRYIYKDTLHNAYYQGPEGSHYGVLTRLGAESIIHRMPSARTQRTKNGHRVVEVPETRTRKGSDSGATFEGILDRHFRESKEKESEKVMRGRRLTMPSSTASQEKRVESYDSANARMEDEERQRQRSSGLYTISSPSTLGPEAMPVDHFASPVSTSPGSRSLSMAGEKSLLDMSEKELETYDAHRKARAMVRADSLASSTYSVRRDSRPIDRLLDIVDEIETDKPDRGSHEKDLEHDFASPLLALGATPRPLAAAATHPSKGMHRKPVGSNLSRRIPATPNPDRTFDSLLGSQQTRNA